MDMLIGYGIVFFVLFKGGPAILSFIFEVISTSVKGMAVLFVMGVLAIVILKTMIGA